MKMTLGCRGYQIRREVGRPASFVVDLVLLGVHPNDIENMSEALKKIEIMLAGEIDLVKAVPDKLRCFYCGVLNDKQNNVCTQCGAAL